MKKSVLLLIVLAVTGVVGAQTSPCGIVITGDFDSECTHNFKGLLPDEYPPLMVACKNSTVTYTATVEAGIAAANWLWYVAGDASHIVSGDQVTVTWSNGEWGMVSASAVTSDGDTCSAANYVKLTDKPSAAAVTIPAYTVMPDGSKVIRVCKGSNVEFTDRSSAGQSDIAGYLWQSNLFNPSSTSTYIMENVTMDDIVKHSVYNNCGCHDEESFAIEVIDGEILQLDCHGTVCKGDMVRYGAIGPACDSYNWHVDGGTIVAGQYTQTPTVRWDHPHDGYGVIGLDGVLCGMEVCPSLMTVRIPVIHDSIAIEGPTELCVGEVAVYTLPVFGSTRYEWTVTPTPGMNTTMVNESNRISVVADQAGTYTVSASYRCGFLDCGPYASRPLTVTVKPRLDIVGNGNICLSNPCDLHTAPAAAVTWSVYDLNDDNAPVAVVGSNPGTALQMTFPHKGSFLVTASHSDYCGPATFVMHVDDVPAPTLSDLDPANRHTVCVGSGLVLRGTPSKPEYDLWWEPECSAATPQRYTGNEVTLHFPVEACGVRVYNYDRTQQCRSSQYYEHALEALTPAVLNIPNPATVCPGSVIVWGSNAVPDQRSEGMLYEWTIQEDRQHCASVHGDHLTNAIVFTVNEVQPQPVPFYMRLSRTYCGTTRYDYIDINVSDSLSATVSIAGPDSVCTGTAATFTGSGGTDTSHYHWEIEGTHHTGSPVSHTFHNEGFRNVTMTYNPYTYCTNPAMLSGSTHTLRVLAPPLVEGIVYNPAATPPCMSLSPALSPTDYTFAWYYNATMIYDPGFPQLPIGVGETFPYMGDGYYRCVVTDRVTGCSTAVMRDFACNDNLILSHGSYNPCTRQITLVAPNTTSPVIWRVTGGSATLEPSGFHNTTCTVTAESPGYITVEASVGLFNCRRSSYTFMVDFIPDFSFSKKCGQMVIHNNSRYINPGTISMTVNGQTVSFPASQQEKVYPAIPVTSSTTYTISLASYNGNPISCGSTWSVYLERTSRSVTVSSANPATPHDKTCDNTPMQLTASLSPAAGVRGCEWNFGDGSSLASGGTSVYHTFEQKLTPYYVSVTVTDEHGCMHTANNELTIHSTYNNLNGEVHQMNSPDCPGVPATLSYIPAVTANYYWRSLTTSYTNLTTAPNFYPTTPGDYFIYVTDDNYCKHEAGSFADFLNKPEAKIVAERNTYCEGSEIKLFGEVSSSHAMDYLWTIGADTSTTPNIAATAHDDGTGTMTVTLTVTDGTTHCSSTAVRVFNITPQPAAPTISVTGSPCISDAPVHLGVTGYSGTVSWNNGDTGPTAYYYTPGPATVYYYDPTLGCPSVEASLDIARQPDLGALLTGCYGKCKEQTGGYLPVYGLTEYNQTIDWLWERDGNTVASGSGCYFISPLLLPLGTGDHTLTVGYPAPTCTETSATLSIATKEVCDCDSVEVTWSIEPTVEECTIHYVVTLKICNRSMVEKFCIDDIVIGDYIDNIIVTHDGLTGRSVPENDCADFTMEMDATSLIPPMLNITLVDETCSKCMKQLAISLIPEIECTLTPELNDIDCSINEGFANGAAVYIDYSVLLPSADVMAFWSEPPMVMDFTVDVNGLVSGLAMFDRGLLSQLAAADSSVCFHAIVCVDGQLCRVKYCIKASKIIELLEQMENREGAKGMGQDRSGEPWLKPNPAFGAVHVEGAGGKVKEVAVMDMHGRRIATHADTDTFDTKGMAAGSYIVRITTTAADGTRRVAYRKLIVID